MRRRIRHLGGGEVAGLAAAYADFEAEDVANASERARIDARSVELAAKTAVLEARKAALLEQIALKKEQEAAASSETSTPPAPPAALPSFTAQAELTWASRPTDVIRCYGAEHMKHATVLITGPTSVIGVHTADALASFGGRVVLAARSEPKAQALIDSIRSRQPNAKLSFLPLDLASLTSVATCAARFLELQASEGWPPLKALILNAGVYNFSGRYVASDDGYERTFAVNHLAHFLLTMRLMPALEAARPSRVVVVGSGSQFGPHLTKDVASADALATLASPSDATQRWFWHGASSRAYGSSKLANTMYALRRLQL